MELQGEDVETLKQEEEPEGIEKNGGENDEEEGIAEAVARWERRKQERLQSSQDQHPDEQVQNQQDNTDDVAQKYGFIVEGCEFERYGRKAYNTSKWEWRIGRQPDNNDDDEDEGIRQNNRITAKPRTKRRKDDDDDDDWSGDSDGEKDLRKRPVPRKKNVQTRSHDNKRQKVVSTSDAKTEHSGIATSTKTASKNVDDDDLDGFLVDDDEEETEVVEEEDEWTDDEDEVEEDEDIEDEEDPVDRDNRPLCKYGNNCFRKNQDHLTQFRH